MYLLTPSCWQAHECLLVEVVQAAGAYLMEFLMESLCASTSSTLCQAYNLCQRDRMLRILHHHNPDRGAGHALFLRCMTHRTLLVLYTSSEVG